ncbi:uncharacterized protein V2V93DRAFT_375321 [Kockiozyma suomiensis]|uniref:uncharacterized protein n=1 Tax=Kockiozyma suomiensis TaxID=1337062 RepID=UPI003343BBC4
MQGNYYYCINLAFLLVFFLLQLLKFQRRGTRNRWEESAVILGGDYGPNRQRVNNAIATMVVVLATDSHSAAAWSWKVEYKPEPITGCVTLLLYCSGAFTGAFLCWLCIAAFSILHGFRAEGRSGDHIRLQRRELGDIITRYANGAETDGFDKSKFAIGEEAEIIIYGVIVKYRKLSGNRHRLRHDSLATEETGIQSSSALIGNVVIASWNEIQDDDRSMSAVEIKALAQSIVDQIDCTQSPIDSKLENKTSRWTFARYNYAAGALEDLADKR